MGSKLSIKGGADSGGVSTDHNAAAGKNLRADSAGKTEGGGEPTRKMAAAADVVGAAILDMGGKVGMGGAGFVGNGGIVVWARIGVGNGGAKGGAAGASLPKTR